MQCQRRCFAIPVASLNAGGGSGGPWIHSATAIRGGGCPGGLLLQLVGFGRDCAGAWAARVLLVVVADVSAGPCVRAVSPGSLLLRLVAFGRGCAGARGRPEYLDNLTTPYYTCPNLTKTMKFPTDLSYNCWMSGKQYIP